MWNALESIEIDGRAELDVLPFAGTTRTLSLQEGAIVVPVFDSVVRRKM
jgi:hypothetical protein